MRMTVSDENLAQAAANGDRQAFAGLLERHYDRLFGLAFRLTGSRAEAQDLTQDICAALPAKLATYRGQSKVTTWLYRVTVNAAHDRRRRMNTYMKASDGWGDWELARQDEVSTGREQLDWLTAAMSRLSHDLRDTLALVLDDLTHAEVASILGVSEGTISWRVSEAKKRLRAIREQEEAI